MRRQSRVCALQVLYQLDLKRILPAPPANDDGAAAAPPGSVADQGAVRDTLQLYWQSFDPVAPAAQAFTTRLVEGVAAALPEVDAALTAAAHHWRLARMDRVDRSILRLATYEILCCPDIPRAASLNEAVELAKCFSGQSAAAFINGVLDGMAEPPPAAPEGDVPVRVDAARCRA